MLHFVLNIQIPPATSLVARPFPPVFESTHIIHQPVS